MSSHLGSPTRRAALALLEAVMTRHRPLEEALDALPKGIAPRDKAAAHRIAGAVLRRAGSLDAVLEPYLRREPPSECGRRCGWGRRSCCCSGRRRMRRWPAR
jgi:16S rRNA (cytosine967-C5)-methyltransferase